MRERRSSCDRPGGTAGAAGRRSGRHLRHPAQCGVLPHPLDGKKRWALAGCTAGLLALQGIFYFGASPTAAQYLYPLITHLPLYVVLVLLSGQKVWPLVAVLTAYLCCQVRRWTALAVALFFPQHPLVQPVAELLFTLPLLLLFIRFLAPSMRQLSHYPASVQCQFGVVPLVSYLFDYITHVYTSLLSEANPAAVEFMFFVCCAAFLCSILRASRVSGSASRWSSYRPA